ncbi:MAG: SDR family oxidoreductase [Candidatus Nitrotoga sp.]
MKFMISGAGGFVGKALSAELLRRGQSVRVAVRSGNSQVENTEVIIIDAIDGETNWIEALRDVDVVIHLAARVHVMRESATDPLAEFLKINLHGTSNLAWQAACSGVKRLVYVSSIKVNGEQTSATQSFTELDEPSPQDFYSVSKWQAEQALWRIAQETGLEIVIVRPPLVYGPGVKGNFAQLLTVASKRIPLPFSLVQNLRSLIYLGNLVDALIACSTHPVAAGQTYLVNDGEDISTPDLLRQIGNAMECPAHFFPVPPNWLRVLGKLTGQTNQIERLLSSLQVDSGKIRHDLNWVPPYTLQHGLQVTAESHRRLGKKG